MPEGRTRRLVIGNLLIVVAACAGAAATSQTGDWQPVTLVAALALFAVGSQLLIIKQSNTGWVISSSAPYALAMTLLGPAPAVAIVIFCLTVDAVRRRLPIPDFASNLANDSFVILTGGLIAQWLIGSRDLTPDEFGFALVFLAAFAWMSVGTLLMVAVSDQLQRGRPMRETLRRQWLLFAFEAPPAALGAAAAYAYARIGTGALGFLAFVQLADQYTTSKRMLSEERAELLQKRADELAALHATLQEHTKRLSELSESRGRLVGQVLAAEETERRRLAEALHDQALQDLLVARQGFPPTSGDGADRARDAIERAIQQLRGAIFDLHPAVLEHAGLKAALREVADHQAERAGFGIEVEVDPEACGPLDSLLFVLGREQLTNAAKHSGATEVELLVTRNNGRVVMEVNDNGRGLEGGRRRAAVEKGHIGLASSAERVEALGGSLEIDSEPGQGTRIRTTLPLRSS